MEKEQKEEILEKKKEEKGEPEKPTPAPNKEENKCSKEEC